MSVELGRLHLQVYNRALRAASEAQDLAADLRALAVEHGDDGCFVDEGVDTVRRTTPSVPEG